MQKTFNLEAAKKGAVIKNEEGSTFKFIAHVPDADIDARVILMHNNNRGIFVVREDGTGVVGLTLHTEPLTITKYLRVYKKDNGKLTPGGVFYNYIEEAKSGGGDFQVVPVTIEI